MTIVPYWHVAAVSNWREVVREQLGTLKRGGFEGTVIVGFCGGVEAERSFMRTASSLGVAVSVAFRKEDWSEFEFPTLELMEGHCREGLVEHVLYFHTKGVSRPRCAHRRHWRRFMNAWMLRGFRHLPRYLKEVDFCAPVISHLPLRHSCGNFFAARAAHIRSLPPLGRFRREFVPEYLKGRLDWLEERHAAEMWIGCGGMARCRQMHPRADCNISDSQWWRAHPAMKRFAAREGMPRRKHSKRKI